MLWLAQITALPHGSSASAEQTIGQLRRLGLPKLQTHQSVYEQVSDTERKRLIGSALETGGMDWLKTHPAQSAWMAANGVSAADCLREFQGYYLAASQGFDPPRKKSPA